MFSFLVVLLFSSPCSHIKIICGGALDFQKVARLWKHPWGRSFFDNFKKSLSKFFFHFHLWNHAWTTTFLWSKIKWTSQNWWTNQISQSIKLANQRRTRDRNGKDNNSNNNSYFWQQKIGWSLKHRNERSKNVMFWLKQRHMNGEKHIAPMDFVEYPTKSDVSENSEVHYCRFLRNGLP